MKGAVGAVCLALGLAVPLHAASPTFPFVYKYDDGSASVTNLSSLLHAPAGLYGFVTVDGSGHLATSAGRQKFFGTNLTYQSNFPSAADAAKVAARMAKFGINLVRFHHMDYTTAPAGIWSSVSPDRVIDPAQLDKLDRFIFELKQKGIYSNINLAVSRPYNYGPTLHTDINLVTDGKLRQALAFFDPALLQLHKDYATDLLTHMNPYTGKAYTNEPALAFIEISNEVGLISQWLGCALDGLPTFYKNELNTLWNNWLAAKYTNFAGLKAAGFGYDQPLGSEMLVNPNFTSGTSNWGLDVSGGAAASWAVTMEGPTSNESAKVQITTPGSAAWNVSLFQGNLNVSTLTPYTVTFWAKASTNRTIAVAVNMNHAPWGGLGFYRQINLTTTWQQFTLGFDLTASDTNARLMFTDLAIPAGTVWVSQVSMKPGGLVGLYAGEDLDTDTMRNFVCNETTLRTTVGRRDWITFLWELEEDYWTAMRDHVKVTLGAKALLMGTAQSFSSANLMALYDVVDTHAYWEHPVFPGTPWDPVDWYLNNTPMTNNQSNTLGWVNMKRVIGKPWSISEYNHPRPLVFDGEMAFFMAGYGAFQDYDAVYEFDYESWTPTFDGQRAAGFFQMNQNPVKMATCLPAAAAFLRGDIAPATGRIVAAMSKATEIDLIRSGGYIPDLAWLGENTKASFVHGVGIATEGTAVPGGSIAPGTTPLPNVLTSDTGELVWDLSVAGQGFVTLDTARSKWAWGTIGTRTINFAGGITVTPGTTMASNLGGVAFTALDGTAPMLTARTIILTTVGVQTNTGQNYYQYPSTATTFPPPLGIQLTSKNEWGTAPSIVEGVPATVTLPFAPLTVRVWSLTATGARNAMVPVVDAGGKAQFTLSDTYKAMQYEIIVNHAKLEATLTAWPNVNTGSNFKITLTISNTGLAVANAVQLVAPFTLNGTAGVSLVAGPSPTMPYSPLNPGTSITFTWTYNGTAPGTKVFSVSVSGVDVTSGQTVTTGLVVSNAVTIIDPVLLLPSIKVNHFGWRPNDQKIAIVNTNPGATAVLHRAGDGSIAYTIPTDGGSITSKGLDPNANENVWQIDFSNFKVEGSYYLKVPALSGNSDVFDLRESVYNRVGYAMLKSFFAQRCGTSHGAAYMGVWADAGVCHSGDTKVDWNSTDDPGGVNYGNDLDLSGGWHDAGDYNKYIGGLDVLGPSSWGGDNGAGVWGIAMGFEMNTTAFKSDGTGIPESGNGIPDALDEMRYEIDWFRKMQAGAGGSAVLSMCHAKAGVFSGGSPPSTDATVRYYTGPTLESTAAAGACFALGARLFAPYDAAYAAILTTAANNAWTGIPAGDDDAKFWFACELYRLDPAGPNATAAKAYVDGYFNYNNDWGMGSMYVNFGALPSRGNSQTAIRGLMAYTLASGATASVVTKMRSQFSQFVTTCFSQAGGYGSGLQNADYNWGSNAYVGSRSTSLLHAARIGATGAKTPAEVRTQAQHYLHYLFGLNGPNMVYVSNVAALGGEHSSYQFYHGWFGNYGDVDGKAAFVGKPPAVVEPAYPYFAGVDSEGFSDNNTSTWGPFPGFVPGGANNNYGTGYGTVTPPAGATGNHYFYRDWVFCCSGFDSSGANALPWTITENSLGYNGPCMAMVAAFMTPETLLTLSKTASGNPLNMFEALTYTIVATSAGGGTAYSISVWDTVPAGVTFGWATAGGVYDGTKVVWTLPNLAPGASYSVSFTVTITSPGPVIGPNVAAGDYRDVLAVQQPTVNTLPVSVNVVAGAYLTAAIAVSPTTIVEGYGFLVTLTITNTGLAMATNLFASPFAQSGDGSGAFLWGPAPVMPFSLAAGASVTLTWSYTGSDLGTVRFTVTPQGIDSGFGGPVATRAVSPPVDITALPGCPLLWNGAEALDNNGAWSGANAIRTINWSVTEAITQGGASLKCDLQTAADWQDGFASVAGFSPASFSGYTSLRVNVYADPADLPWLAGVPWKQMFLYAEAAGVGKFYQAISSTVAPVNAGMNSVVFTLDYPNTITATDPLSRVFLVFQTAGGYAAAGNFYLDNFRLTGTMTGGVLAAAGSRPPTIGIGGVATVTLTVTNTGSAAVIGVLPGLTESLGAFRVEHLTGPVPPGPVDLLPGQKQTFVWTVSASGGGLVVFTPTATGGTCSGALVTNGVALTMTITGPAAMTAGLNAFPSPRNIGQPFWVTLTVTNTGGATATIYLSSTILIVSGSSSSTVAAGPLPSVFPVVLAAGAQRTFTWTLTGAVSGTLYLTATVTGRDWLANGWLGPYVLTSNAVLIQTPAVLTVSAYAYSSPRQVGLPFNVAVTVTNYGEEWVSGIAFGSPLRSGSGNATFTGGPFPATPFTLPGNSATTFTWNYTASAAGWVAYTVTLAGTRANLGTPVTIGPRPSGSVYIVTPAALSAWVAAGPINVSVGQAILVTVTVTNTGGTPAYGLSSTPIYTDAASTGEVVYTAGPSPAQSTTIAGGGILTFTWTFTATTPGWVLFRAGVSATDLLSGALLNTGVLDANGGVPVNILAPAILEGSLLTAQPTSLCVGDAIQLVMSLTNSGAASATAIVPSTSLFIEGTGAAVLFASPRPLTHLGPGGINAVRLTWSYSVTAPGDFRFTATVTGADANTWMPLTTGPRWSNTVTAFAPGVLSAYLSAPESADPGITPQIEVVLTLTNTGGQPVDLSEVQITDTDGCSTWTCLNFGPSPVAPPLVLPPGGTVMFTWVYDVFVAFNPGDIIWSATAWGTTCGTQNLRSWDTTSLTAASLVASSRAFPATRTVGQNILVTLTVTNTGNVPANVITSDPWIVGGGGGAALVAGPTPAQGSALAPGARITFTWTFSASSAGFVEFTTTVHGFDSVSGGPLAVAPVVSNTVAILTPAALDASVVIFPSPRNTTQTFLVTLTVTNTGQATANTITLPSLTTPYGIWGGGAATKTAGPWPGMPLGSLAGGATVTFTWTYTANTAGLVVFGTTVTGIDAVSGAVLNTGLNLSNTLWIQTPAALATMLRVFPGPARNIGQDFLVTLTVTNTGGATAQSLNTKGFMIAGPGGAAYAGGPEPPLGSFDLPGGASQVFTWTYTGSLAGLVRYSTTVTALDANSGAALGLVATSNTILIQAGALLDAMVTLSAGSICTGQNFQVRLTVTNGGQASATLFMAEAWELTGGGLASLVAGPSSATPFVLPGGATRTFTWTFTGSVAGPLAFSTTVNAVDVNSGELLVMGPVAGPEITVGVPGALEVATAVQPYASVASWFTVSLTVTNTGGTDVTGITATMYAGPGGALVGYQTASVPPGPLTLAPGASQTFVWTRSASAPGVVTFTATAVGTTCGSTVLRVNDPVSATIQTAVLLRAAISLTPTSMCGGQPFVLTLTVTNSGQADALGVTVPASPFAFGGAGSVSILAGPSPALPATIPGGTTLRYTWTLAGASAGTAILTTTVTGLDANSGLVKTSLPAARSVTVGAAGALAASVSGPVQVSVGQWFQVRLTVTNTGGASITGLTASAFLDPWSGGASWVSGATPPNLTTLAAGTTTTFVWTWSAAGAGTVSFSLTTVGSTVCGVAIPVIGTGSLPVVVQAPATLSAAVVQLAGAICAGQDYLVTLTVTNTGTAAANALSLPAPPFTVGGGGNATLAAGPTPALPATLAGGASVTLTWTFTGAAPGQVVLTTTVTGQDANSLKPVSSGPSPSAAITVSAAASLSAATAVSPRVASTAQWLTVSLTVTNTGGADATGVTATIFIGPGAGIAPLIDGPVPAGPVTLGSGSAQTFVWTVSAGGSGVVTFTATATGSTCASLTVLAASSVSATLQTPAALMAATAVFPAAPCLGQPFWLTLTITNTGQATATAVTPAPWLVSGSGGLSAFTGPNPAAPAMLSGGTSVTFTYTLTASSSGSVSFSTTISAADQNSGLGLLVSPVLAGPQALVSAGALAAAVSVSPATVSAGQWATVSITVTNTGGSDVTGLTATAFVAPGAALVQVQDGPTGPVTLGAGTAQTFAWTFSTAGAGTAVFTLTATGATLCGGAPVALSGTGTGALAIQSPARLVGSLVAFPSPRVTGQSFLVTLTVTNTGQAAATGLGAIAFLHEGTGTAGELAGPTPALGGSLAGGASVTFTWTFAGTAPGTVFLTTTVSGVDANSALTVSTGPVRSNAEVIVAPAALEASLVAFPGVVNVGQPFLVTLTVTNTGGATATGLTASAFIASGTATAGAGTGPTPGFPVSLAAGASLTFTWTCTASSSGSVWFTTTVFGTDAIAGTPVINGPVVSNPVTVQVPAQLVASLDAFPSPRTVGQTFLATLTITNTGGATVTGVDPAAFIVSGSGGIGGPVGPTPAAPVSLSGGASITFTWTCTASSPGSVWLTTTVTGTDATSGGGLATGPVVSPVVVIQTPAALAVSVVAFPSPRTQGQPFLVTVTVTNTGGATATGLAVEPFWLAGTGAATYDSGPNPVLPGSLAGGAGATFTWTFTGSSPGTVTFTTTVTASDANTGSGITSGPATSNAELILPPAALDVSLVAFPATRNIGQPFWVTLTVTNTGGTTILGVTASSFIVSGSAGLGAETGPTPAFPVTLASGASMTFTWTESGTSAGSVWFTTTVYGTDQISGNPVEVGPVVSNPVNIQTPAALVAVLDAFPSPRTVGQTFLATLTITNTGQATATGVDPAAFVVSGSGAIGGPVGPNPSAPVTLIGGVSITFSFTCTASSSGQVWLTTTVTGTDANTGGGLMVAPVVSPAVLIQTPAALVASVAAFPSPRTTGQNFLITVTVTNTGEATAMGPGLSPFLLSGAGGATYASGPNPGLPASLAGGAAVTFTWTYTGSAPGTVFFTTTATATDANSGNALTSGPATSNAEVIVAPAALEASLVAFPAWVNVGQPFLVTLTVTNTGGSTVAGLTASAFIASGTAAPGGASGPTPAVPVSLGSGGSITFTWTCTATSSGSVWFTTTVFGTDSIAGVPVQVGPVVSNIVTIQTPAQLVAALDAFPSPRTVGQTFLATLTITNTGQATATSVDPAAFVVSGSGGIGGPVGPNPTAPVTLSGGTSMTFTWTVTASSSGSVWLTTTVTGLDANSGASILIAPVVSPAVLIQTPAQLVAALDAFPSPRTVGQTFLATLTITNTGQATATGVDPAAFVVSGNGGLGAVLGPNPTAPVTLSGGTSITFTWTCTASSSGSVWLTTTVTGMDANTGGGLTVAPVISPAVVIQAPAALSLAVAVFPPSICTGDSFLVTATVTNTGEATATGVDVPAPAFAVAGTGSVAAPVGPNPALPVSLAGGSAITFTWTFTALGAGGVTLTTTVAGADANTGGVVAAAGWADGVIGSPGALLAAAATPALVSRGQPFSVSLTVTNTGGTAVTGVSATAFAGPGGALVLPLTGPVPAGPITIPAGGMTTFVWTWSATAAGPVTFTLSAAGSTCAATPLLVDATTALVVQEPATLAASLAAFPTPRNVGQTFLATLTITNTGQATATGVDPAAFVVSGTGGLGAISVPTPTAPVTLSGGTSITFSFTCTASSSGPVWLTTTVTGTDANSGGVLAVAPVVSPAVLIQSPAALVASLVAFPSPRNIGQTFLATLTITNTGEATANGVDPAAFVVSGSGGIAGPTGPNPSAPVTLIGGTSVTLTWTGTASSPGSIWLTTTVTATDANTGGGLAAGPVVSGVVVIQLPALLSASISVSSTMVCTAAPVVVTVEVANLGGADATLPAVAPWLAAGPGGLAPAAGPEPALPAAIAGGTVLRFSWTFTGLTAGVTGLSTTVTATDANDGTPRSTGGLAGPAMRVYDPGVLAAALAAPAAVSVGQPFGAILTLTNTGGAAVTVTGLDLGAAPGAALVSPPGPFLPALPVTIGPGGSAAFAWSFTATGSGPVALTVTATGSDVCGAPAATATAGLAVQSPAALAVSAAAFPAVRALGQSFTVTVTVTNTGEAAATGFTLAPLMPAGTGAAGYLAGPAPALPGSLAGGAAATFSWTFSTTALGTVEFTTTATAMDANTGAGVSSGPATSNVVTILPPAALDISLVAWRSVANTGQPFLVTLTVTNTGGTAVIDLTASAFVASGTAGPGAGSGPTPPFPVTLAPGASVTFTWTQSGGSAGSLWLSTTIYGTDQISGNPVEVGPVTSSVVTIQSPAVLTAALDAFPTPRSVGQTFLATLTITNTGQATATGVDPAAFMVSGSGGIAGPVGPTPAAPVTLSGGASITWTWTGTASSSGSVWLTTTVTGTDGNDGTVITVMPVVSPVVVIQSPAVLAAALVAFPAPRTIGQTFAVHLTVTNTGEASAGPLTVPPFVVTGAGVATLLAGPVPGLPYASLAGGASVTFVWTYSATAAGTVSFTATVNGFDANSGAALSTGPVTTPAPQTIQTPAALAAALAGLPATMTAGQSVIVTLTVTNNGQATATTVDPGSLFPTGTGGFSAVVGPMPVAPVSLIGGTAITFSFTVTASSSGSVSLTATVTGQDGNSAAWLSTGPVATTAVLVQAPAALAASAVAFPTPRNVGQSFLVTLTVTNTGQAAVSGLSPAAFVVSGSGGIGGTTGPNPPAPVTLGGGASVTFTWTLTASSSGSVSFSTTVTGADANAGWALSIAPVVTNAVVLETPALLAGSLAAFPTPRNAGQSFLVTLSLTNSGGATATGLALAPFRVSGAGGASVAAGPTPALPGSLAGGASVVLTWTFTGGPALGFLNLSVTATGTDANSLLAISTGPVASATVLIQSPAALIASAAVSNTTLCVGNTFLLTLTVTNTGQATATGVTPAAFGLAGTGGVTVSAGPNPAAPVSLSGGTSVTFTWTCTASSSGSVSFSTTVNGLDANSGALIQSSTVVSPVAGISAIGVLSARWSLPAAVSVGQSFGVTLTVTNTGGATLGGVFPVVVTGAGVSPVSGPVPAAPVTLAPGAAQTFAWTYSGASAGMPAFTATVSGTDLCAVRTTAASATVAVQSAALLVARLTVSPDPANIGSNFMVMLTITNSGQAAATGVNAAAFALTGPGAATLVGGPSPALPVALPGGAAVTFTWTWTGTVAGAFGLTTTVTGTDANSGTALATGPVTGGVALTTGAVLTAQAGLSPLTVSVGQVVTVSFTVSNTPGANNAINLLPVLANESAAGLALMTAPPPGPYAIAGGAGQTFVWTWSPTSAGALSFALTVTGQDAFSLAPLFATAVAGGLVQTPAALTAGMTLSTTLIYVGDTMLVTVTAGNAGQAAATGVLPPALGITGGGVTVVAAPPAVSGSIPGGGTVTWTWTLAGAAPASASFTVTVAGTDANSGLPVTALAVSTLPLRVATLGLTAFRLQATPVALGLDQIVTLVLSVSNTGTLPAPGILPRAWWTGDGVVAAISGPAPALASLLPGQTASFTWTFRTMRGGTVIFQANAASSTGAKSGTIAANPVTILESGETLADLVVYPDPFRYADAIGGTIKFRRMPPFTKVRIYTVAAETIAEFESGSIGLVEWDGRNKTGTRVTPGVYFWVAESKAGERKVGKLQIAP